VRRAGCSGARGFHAVALDAGDVVYTWGIGEYHVLGYGGEEGADAPQVVAALSGRRVVALSCGSLHAAVITADGQLLTWGYDSLGQLGHFGPTPESWVDDADYEDQAQYLVAGEFPHNVIDESDPRRPRAAMVAKAVSCGSRSTVIVKASGEVATCGCGAWGMHGHGLSGDRGVVQLGDGPHAWSDYKLNIMLPRVVAGLRA
jgi:alpha-tubulin suppressor-like RCC1 family protein